MKRLLCILFTVIVLSLGATEIAPRRALNIAEDILGSQSRLHRIHEGETLYSASTALAYVYHLSPSGYIVISAQEELPVLMAYSLESPFRDRSGKNLLQELLLADLANRLSYPPLHEVNRRQWLEAERRAPGMNLRNEYLLNTSWNQTHPWNSMCPMDLVSQSRSLAGCPAIAMAQILNYLQTLNGTRLDDTDDYYHSYAGRNYMIDDDFLELGFPSFADLNTSLDEVDATFRLGNPLSSTTSAALVFAAGTALKQVYSSQGSGTFAVSQAYTAFQRFGFPNTELLGPTAENLYTKMIANLSDGIPVHLAVVTPAWDAGHNVVVDGYSAEGMYHLNFGWGGSYNGWYNLPEGIPYNLSVVEGAVVDIYPVVSIMSLPAALQIEAGGSQTIELVNLSNSPLQLQYIVFGEGLNAAEWSINPGLYSTIAAMDLLNITISHNIPAREQIESTIRLVFDHAWLELPLTLSSGSSTEDMQQTPPALSVRVSPNPFSERCEFLLSEGKASPMSLSIYNLKGQLVKISEEPLWDGNTQSGDSCPSGIYLYRLQSGNRTVLGKVLKR